MRKARGESKLCSVTYTQLSEWTLLSVGALRNMQHAGVIDVRNLVGILTWVNRRRARLGLPMIGQPADDLPQRTLKIPDTDEPFILPYTCEGYPHYNPMTGDYDE
jgi:hypothetical protein